MYNKTKYIFLKFIEKYNIYIVHYFSELIKAKNSPMESLTSGQYVVTNLEKIKIKYIWKFL